jgi:hypothetical protein
VILPICDDAAVSYRCSAEVRRHSDLSRGRPGTYLESNERHAVLHAVRELGKPLNRLAETIRTAGRTGAPRVRGMNP